MISILLSLHVLGALFMGAISLIAMYELFGDKIQALAMHARNISLLLFFELASGSLLFLLASAPSMVSFCQNIGAYCLTVIVVLALIHRKLATTHHTEAFPSRFVSLSVFGAMVSTLPVFVGVFS